MNIVEYDEGILLKDVNDFSSKHIFECGQCFRWDKADGNSYIGIVKDKVVEVEQEGNQVKIKNIDYEEFEQYFKDYFDFETDYSKIKNKLSKDKTLNEAIKFGWGIRILYQDIWECLFSFIISANNRIPMIKRAVNNISKKYGKEILYKGNKYYGFPTAEDLKDATIEDFEKCGVGFRAKYLKKLVEDYLEGKINLDKIENLDTNKAREELQKLSGVGPKIADCVLLFSAKKYDAFPIDIWVKRVMEHFYSDRELKMNEIQKMANQLFGDDAGIAQQYLFYYAREMKIGK